ncbi:TPA: exo-alpha-sialidase [Candidatus Latescibacteria bacterium]|nr:exo-alpha-sialidase [Candidatus Latescibacterota bacterium]
MDRLGMTKQDLFISGEDGYHTYRIPALVKTTSGRVLAFCEGRRVSRSDSGDIDLLVRSSDDDGVTWSDPRVVVSDPGMTCGNPCPVVDHESGRIVLAFCKNIGVLSEKVICEGNGPRTVWLTRSEDDGKTWNTAEEITESTKDPAWTWYATGPCHGVQLSDGRLVVPCDHMVGVYLDRHADPYHSHVILSDDGGFTWRIGGIVSEGTNECTVAAHDVSGVYINCRNYRQQKCRAASWSEDRGETFGRFRYESDLVDPICQGALLDLGQGRYVLSNAASESRERVSLRVTEDGGETWSDPFCLFEGPSAYSDIVELSNARAGCLLECGDEAPYERLSFVSLSIEDVSGT